jgi:hypothetical protein
MDLQDLKELTEELKRFTDDEYIEFDTATNIQNTDMETEKKTIKKD